MAFSCGTVEQENAVRARKVFWRYPVAKHTSGSQTCPVEFLIGSLAAADLLFKPSGYNRGEERRCSRAPQLQ
jgi:hypothetical protein